MFKIIKIACLILLCTSCEPITSQNTKILADDIAEKHFQEKTNIGLSIGIIKNDVLETFNYGGKYTNGSEDINNETLFEIGSVTKIYTTFILATLETRNKISRYDLLNKYLPKTISHKKKWASRIKLVDLATHTSGLPAFDSTKSLVKLEGFDENNPYGLFTNEFMLNILKNTDNIPDYGSIKYSNFGIGILGYAMAQAEETTFENLFEKYIVKDLELNSTFLTLNEQNLLNVAIPHRKSEQMPLIQLAGMSPSGSIKTSMPDLLKFLNLHLQKPDSVKLVIDIVLQNQLQGDEQAVGLGWGIHTIANETAYFHNGGTYGSSSIVIIVPSRKIGIAILANNRVDNKLRSYALELIDKLVE